MARGRKKKSAGLGDTIEKIPEQTGIKSVVKFIAGDDCGCEERKEKLNRLFPYKHPNCLTEKEYEYLNAFFLKKSIYVTQEDQKHLWAIYDRVFNVKNKHTNTSCSECVRSLVSSLRTVYDQYNV